MYPFVAVIVAVMVTGGCTAPTTTSEPARSSGKNFDSLVEGLYSFYYDNWKKSMKMARLAQFAANAKAPAKTQSDYYDYYNNYPYTDLSYWDDWRDTKGTTRDILQSNLQGLMNAQARPKAKAQFNYYDYYPYTTPTYDYWKKENVRGAVQTNSHGLLQNTQAQGLDSCLEYFSLEYCNLIYPASRSQKLQTADAAKMSKSDSIKAALQRALLASEQAKQEN